MKSPAALCRHRGFTMIEVVITVALTALLLMALASLFGTFSSLERYQQGYAGVTGDAGTVMHAIESAALPADTVLASHAFAGGTYTTGAAVLVLELPSVGSTGTVLDSAHDYVAFYQAGAAAYRVVEVGAGSARRAGTTMLGSRVVSLSFGYDNASPPLATTVTATVVASTTAKGVGIADELTEALRLRNK